MTDEELIARQARQVAELELRVAALEKARDSVHPLLFGIGGPLNDNRGGFTRTQLRTFDRIAEALEIQ